MFKVQIKLFIKILFEINKCFEKVKFKIWIPIASPNSLHTTLSSQCALPSHTSHPIHIVQCSFHTLLVPSTLNPLPCPFLLLPTELSNPRKSSSNFLSHPHPPLSVIISKYHVVNKPCIWSCIILSVKIFNFISLKPRV